MFNRIEALVFAVLMYQLADMTHFTWWAIASLIVSDVLVESNLHCVHVNVLAGSIAVLVSLAVAGLSVVRCSLFQGALDDLGAPVYALGNFAVHYWPSLRLVVRICTSEVPAKLHLTTVPAQVLLLYTALNNPTVEYRCPPNLSHVTFVVGSLFASVGIELGLAFAATQCHAVRSELARYGSGN